MPLDARCPRPPLRPPLAAAQRALAAAVGGLVGGSLLFVSVGWWALESGGVAVVETRAEDGSLRETRVWFAEPEDELWLEAGTPENAWFRDVLRDPRIELRAGARSGRYLARPVDDPSGHDRVRALLREKYGLRDCWVGLWVDTSRSVAVQLTPRETPSEP